MKKQFRIPEALEAIEPSVVVAVVDSIPVGWCILRGTLYAPQPMISAREALASTKLVFDSSIAQMIDRTGKDRPDIFGVLIEGKKPAEVWFGRTFGHCEVMPMVQSKRMVNHFVMLGYRGRLTFRWRDPEDRDKVSFECEIWMPHHQRDLITTITVESNDKDDAVNGATLYPIIELCDKLKLPEIELVKRVLVS